MSLTNISSSPASSAIDCNASFTDASPNMCPVEVGDGRAIEYHLMTLFPADGGQLILRSKGLRRLQKDIQ